MKTCKHTEGSLIPSDFSPRPLGGFFITTTFTGKRREGLTKVNKPCANGLFSIICNNPELSDIIPFITIVNKKARVLYIILRYRLTLLHHLFNFNFFELPLRLGRQARFLYVENAGLSGAIQKKSEACLPRQLLGFYF